MATKNPAVISRVGQRRQVVIPKRIAEELGLDVGDFVAVERHRGSVVIKPQRLVDADDVLTTEEGELLKKAEQQIRLGHSVKLAALDHEMDRKPRERSRKTT